MSLNIAKLVHNCLYGAMMGASVGAVTSFLSPQMEPVHDLAASTEYLESDPGLRDCVIYLKPFQDYAKDTFRELVETINAVVQTYADCVRLGKEGDVKKSLSQQVRMTGLVNRLEHLVKDLKAKCHLQRLLPQDSQFLDEQLDQLLGMVDAYSNNIMMDGPDSFNFEEN